MRQRNPNTRRPTAPAKGKPLSEAEALPFLYLAWAPDWAPPFLSDWLGAESEAREAVIADVIKDPDFLRLDAQQRAKALAVLSDARDMAWKLDLEARGIAKNLVRLKAETKAPGFQKARKAFRAVEEIFGDPPFPVFGARGKGLGPHAAMAAAAHEFLDATLRSFPAIGLEFQDLAPTRTRNFSRAPKAPYQRNLKRELQGLGLSRENVSRLLYAVRLTPKLSADLRPV